jgi:hypothetical protein
MRAPKVSITKDEEIKDEEKRTELMTKKIDEILRESTDLQNFLKRIRVEYRGFTITDFNYEKAIREKREERVTTKMEIEIGENRGEAKRKEMAAIAKSTKDLEESGFPASEAQRIASERYQDHLVSDKGTLQKVVWTGGGNINIPEIAALWETGKQMPMGKQPQPPGEPGVPRETEPTTEPKPAELVEPTETEEDKIEKEIDKIVEKKKITKKEWYQILELIKKLPFPKRKEKGHAVAEMVAAGEIKIGFKK